MTMATRPVPRHWLGRCGLLGIVAASGYVRWPAFTHGGFVSHDVAGILYGGMLLHAGRLPYVDSYELKSPGAFYLAAWLSGSDATDIANFQIWANLVALASLLVVGGIGLRWWGTWRGLAAALLYALHDAALDSMDANYVTWAQLPMLTAVATALVTVERPLGGHRLLTPLAWCTAGFFAGAAMLLKQPTGLVALCMVVALALWPDGMDAERRRPGRTRLVALSWVVVGLASVHLPIALHYAHHGAFDAFVRGYLWNERVHTYVRAGTLTGASDAWREGSAATLHFLALPLALTAFALWPPQDPHHRRRAVLLALWMAAALASAAIGFRFYKGYFLPVAAPLCLFAAAPWGLFGDERARTWLARALPIALLLPLVARQADILRQERVFRAQVHDEGVHRIAEHLREHAPEGATLWVWGWHLWDLYPATGMLSPTRLYKADNVIASDNDATWRRPRSEMHFRDGPLAETLLAELQADPPFAIVLGSAVPHDEFIELRRFLRTQYRRDRRVRVGLVQIWVRVRRTAPRPLLRP